MDERFLIQLRDCFTGGYTLPQFCIDNGIKKPLFVAEGKSWQFVWEIYVQFHYDKRMTAQFSFLDIAPGSINFSAYGILRAMQFKHISQFNPDDIDAVICLTSKKIFSGGRVIYLDALTDYFIRKTYTEIPLLHFLQRHPNVKLFLTNFPPINRYDTDGKFNSTLYDLYEFIERLRADKRGNFKTPLDKFGYTNAQVLEMTEAPEVKVHLDGTTTLLDDPAKPLQGIKHGKRMTAYQPEHYEGKIYFVSGCHHYGIHAPFDKTLESYLQKMLNEHNLPYCVENESQSPMGRNQDLFYNLNKLSPKPNDIIFFDNLYMYSENIPFCDVSNAFDPPNDYRKCYCTKGHMNELGYKILAEKYFDFLTMNSFFRDKKFKYPPPVNLFIATVYRRNSNVPARQLSSTRSLRLTSKNFARKEFQPAQSS